jgi:hypothetical protein
MLRQVVPFLTEDDQMKEKIIEALKKLDPTADSQWTKEGEVNLVAFKFMLGGEAVTREQIEEAAPGFNRAHPIVGEVIKVPEEITTVAETGLTSAAPEALLNVGTVIPPAEPANVGGAGEALETDIEGEELTVLVESTLTDGLRALLHLANERKPVSEMTQEEIAELHHHSIDIRGHLMEVKQRVVQLATEYDDYLHEVTAAYKRNAPKAHQHVMIQAAYAATMGSAKPVDKGRPRALPNYPSLMKRS